MAKIKLCSCLINSGEKEKIETSHKSLPKPFNSYKPRDSQSRERKRERDPHLSSSLVIGDLDISSITDKGDIGIHTGECTAHAL